MDVSAFTVITRDAAFISLNLIKIEAISASVSAARGRKRRERELKDRLPCIAS